MTPCQERRKLIPFCQEAGIARGKEGVLKGVVFAFSNIESSCVILLQTKCNMYAVVLKLVGRRGGGGGYGRNQDPFLCLKMLKIKNNFMFLNQIRCNKLSLS
jgi:hypothetical protein